MAKRIAAAILLCAVMVMIAAAPLATADTHHVAKGAQGPRASAVTWDYVPVDYGTWYGHIVNNGLRSLVVDVFDNSTGVLESIMHQRIRFAAYDAFPTGTVNSSGVVMSPIPHKYVITVTPNGPKGSYCDVRDDFKLAIPPVAVISVTSQVSLTVTVDGSLSYDPDGLIMGYAWAFGDGGVATGVTATHTYALGGTYDITLAVVDSDGLTGTAVQPVTVVKELIPPVASFTAVMNWMVVTVDASASYDPDGTTLTYAWAFGDGATASVVSTTHTYALEGTYTITLTVTDVDLLSTSATPQIVNAVMPKPPVAVIAVDLVNYLEVTVNGTGSSDPDGIIVSYLWSFGDGGSATAVSASHTYAADGTYPITLTVTDREGLTGTASTPVTVHHKPVPPVASFTAVMNWMVVTVDASASYDPDGTTLTYAWAFGDGATASVVSTTHTYALEGTYTITLTVTDVDLLSTSATPQIVNAVMPKPPVAVITLDSQVDLSVTVSGTLSYDPDGIIVSYLWNFGDGGSATTVTATHTYAADGTYLIQLKVTDGEGLSGTASLSVSVALPVDNPPVAFFTWTVSGLTVNVNAAGSTDDHGIVSYVWNWGDGTPLGSGMITSHTYVVQAPPAPAPGSHRASAPIIGAAPPLTPYLLYGYTKDALGKPYECYVTITNLRTGEVNTTNSFKDPLWPIDGYYQFDLANSITLGYLVGDLYRVDAVSVSGTMAGSTTAAVPGGGSFPVDVTLVPLPFDRTITLTVTDTKGQTSTYSATVRLYP